MTKWQSAKEDTNTAEENGVLISTILRQYFLSVRVLGQWQRWSASLKRHWATVHRNLHCDGWLKAPSARTSPTSERVPVVPIHQISKRPHLRRTTRYHYGRFPRLPADEEHQDTDDSNQMDSNPEILISPRPLTNYVTAPAQSAAEEERRLRLSRLVVRKWMRKAGLTPSAASTFDEEDGVGGEFTPTWTPGIAPRLEGRIIIEDSRDGNGTSVLANGV